MDSQYDTEHGYDDWVLMDVEDASSITAQGIKQSVTGDEDHIHFDIDELEVLVCQQRDWKESRKMKKPMILQSILGELHELDKNMELSHAEMQLKAGLVTTWLKLLLHSQKPRLTLQAGYKYSMWSVVQELYHNCVQKKLATMREDAGDEEGPKPIGVYQQVLTTFIQDDLSDKQLAAMQDIAAKWNGMEGPTPDIKAKCLETQQNMGISISAILWKRCGGIAACGSYALQGGKMQKVLWRHAYGTSFNEVWNLEGSWWDYLGEAFEEDEISDDEEDGQSEGSPRKKAAMTMKVDPITLVTKEDRTVSISEIAGLSHDLLQKMASPAIFAAVDMPRLSHDHHGRVNSGAKSSHPKCLHHRRIVPETDTDHDDDLLEDWQPKPNEGHEESPIPHKTTAQIQPDDEHPKDTHWVHNKTPFPGRAMKAPTISYADDDTFHSDEVNGSEALGTADELPTLSKGTPD
ncbi:hypothetical protein BKA82DRAFT_4361201 [Pisolithus tinctorius]|nr:hypothetical protein BKA82DRAFT_4361201 [Pisolithus tinctorius]